MKSFKKFTGLMVLLAVMLTSACNEADNDFELPANLLDFPSEVSINTLDPVVNPVSVDFKGRVTQGRGLQNVEYGFMWYEPNAANVVIHEIRVGSGTFAGDFTLNKIDLPRNVPLIVCAYVKKEVNPGGNPNPADEGTQIGEEVEFTFD